jgi:cytochrome bd ubiquinol oxidase subunit II
LRFVFIGTCIVLPLVVAYTLLSYRVFWGKVKDLTYGG